MMLTASIRVGSDHKFTSIYRVVQYEGEYYIVFQTTDDAKSYAALKLDTDQIKTVAPELNMPRFYVGHLTLDDVKVIPKVDFFDEEDWPDAPQR